MVPCKTTAEEVSFEWTHHRISSTDLKFTATLNASIINSESERRSIQKNSDLSGNQSECSFHCRPVQLDNKGMFTDVICDVIFITLSNATFVASVNYMHSRNNFCAMHV